MAHSRKSIDEKKAASNKSKTTTPSIIGLRTQQYGPLIIRLITGFQGAGVPSPPLAQKVRTDHIAKNKPNAKKSIAALKRKLGGFVNSKDDYINQLVSDEIIRCD